MKVEKRFSHGLNMLGNYTWSKFLDDVEGSSELGGGNGNGYQHIDARGLDKAHVRQRHPAPPGFQLAVRTARRQGTALGYSATRSWITSWADGRWAAFSKRAPARRTGSTESTNRLNAFSESQRPNLLRDPNLPGGRSRDEMIQQFFDTTAFQAPGDGVLGQRGPHQRPRAGLLRRGRFRSTSCSGSPSVSG